jgi:hypothetical protein
MSELEPCPFCSMSFDILRNRDKQDYAKHPFNDKCPLSLYEWLPSDFGKLNTRPSVEPSAMICPGCNGDADNGHDRCDPPNPYYCTKCEANQQAAGDVDLVAEMDKLHEQLRGSFAETGRLREAICKACGITWDKVMPSDNALIEALAHRPIAAPEVTSHPTLDIDLHILLTSLTDPENQPHQYVGNKDFLRRSLEPHLRQSPLAGTEVEKIKCEMAKDFYGHDDEMWSLPLADHRVIDYLHGKGMLRGKE